ncbi:MAG: acyltransferase [Brevinema sp.]
MKIGEHTHVAETAIIRQPDHCIIGAYGSILDYTLISPKLTLGNFCLIDRLCIIAGSSYHFTMEDFTGLGGGVSIWCQSNDYVHNLVSSRAQFTGDVILKKYSGVGAGTVVMPNNVIPEGTTIGANSFVPYNFPLKEWSVYAGSPVRFIKARDKESVLKEAEELALALKS